MASRIVQLWGRELAPGWSGLYRADGFARAVVAVGGARLERLDFGAPLDLDALMGGDPENLYDIDVMRGTVAGIPDGSGSVCGGEGSHGSFGFFARLGRAGELLWIMVLTDGNPFEAAEVRGSLATFTNNLGNSVTVDLTEPDFA
ncbi:hypothetical protein [Hamadaea tsunoensis]|uniref:hypothetical protein n=1 Tax=Hamadaea tsunoensis TaxID=53368 RepID=UPI0012F9E547|nr:hypothetical protein [Hamadaea tsunoensis]